MALPFIPSINPALNVTQAPKPPESKNAWKKPAFAILAVGGAVGIYFGARAIYKAATKPHKTNINIETEGGGIPATGYDESGNPIAWSPAPLVGRLFNAMKGWGGQMAKEKAWEELATLPTDAMVKATSDLFFELHSTYDTDTPSLASWIPGETGYPFGSWKQDALDRLLKLNLI